MYLYIYLRASPAAAGPPWLLLDGGWLRLTAADAVAASGSATASGGDVGDDGVGDVGRVYNAGGDRVVGVIGVVAAIGLEAALATPSVTPRILRLF